MPTPTPQNNTKLTMIFDLKSPSGVEDQAQFGVWGAWNEGEPTDYDAALQGLADDALADWIADIDKADYSSAAVLSTCIATHYSTAGATVNEKRAVAGPTDWVGSQIRSLPWECSLAFSLYSYTPGTFVAHAARRRGRCYMPPLGAGVLANNSAGQLADDEAMSLLTDFKTWLTDVFSHTYDSDKHFQPSVFSREAVHLYPVTDLVVDGKIDSQRRRERQQNATRQTLSFSE